MKGSYTDIVSIYLFLLQLAPAHLFLIGFWTISFTALSIIITTQEAGSIVEASLPNLQAHLNWSPWSQPAPYTDVPMADVEDIVDWEPTWT
jgi:hypothetical protein